MPIGLVVYIQPITHPERYPCPEASPSDSPPEDDAALKRIRDALGLTTYADTIRALIHKAAEVAPAASPKPKAKAKAAPAPKGRVAGYATDGSPIYR